MRGLRASGRGSGEAGFVIPLYAAGMVAMLTMMALVLDIGQLRTDRRANKGVADAAAAAGVGRLAFGPWSGVCKARDYLLGNGRGFSMFDAGSEKWSNAAAPAAFLTTSPCPARTTSADPMPCSPGNPATWARLQATARGGRFTIEIQAGYALPDVRFSEDTAISDDNGAVEQGACDNLAVIISQQRSAFFAQVAGLAEMATRVRSVGRLNATETIDYVAALHLLERNACNVLQTGGSNTRVIAQPYGSQPGIIQIDSAGDAGSCPAPIVNGQATTGGPSIIACSVVSTVAGCRPGTGDRVSRVGVYARNFSRPPGDIASSYPTTYGDTAVVGTVRTGRRFADKRYRGNVAALDAEARSVLTGNSGRPPGCTSVTANGCTSTTDGRVWLVLQPADCGNLGAFFSVSGRRSAPNIWFNCDLDVTTDLALTAPDSYVVITGALSQRAPFTIDDPRRLYIGGRSSGNRIGLDAGGPPSALRVNLGGYDSCQIREASARPPKATRIVVGAGSFTVSSGAAVQLCHSFVYLASGYGTVPSTDASLPCSNPCSGYTGTISVSSGSSLRWSAPNQIRSRLPTPEELLWDANPFEDLALWTEAGGNANSVSSNEGTVLTGVFFLPNADSFNLAGGAGLAIDLSAQFIARTLKVTGGATVNLVPTPQDSIPVVVYATLLVR